MSVTLDQRKRIDEFLKAIREASKKYDITLSAQPCEIIDLVAMREYRTGKMSGDKWISWTGIQIYRDPSGEIKFEWNDQDFPGEAT